jgi:signal transduction histidine kinase
MSDLGEQTIPREDGASPWRRWNRRDGQNRRGQWRAGDRFGSAGWRGDLLLPTVLAVVQLGGSAAMSTGGGGPRLDLLDWLMLVVGPVALTARRRFPVAVMWIALAATLVPISAPLGNLSLIAAFFTAALSGHRRASWLAIVVGYVSTCWLSPLVHRQPSASLQGAVLIAAWLLVLVITVEAVRMRRERTVHLQAARRLDTRHRAGQERLRMARDLHDVIGHNISLINVQASVGLDLMDSRPEQARVALAAIKSVSKEALDELRAMLATLRQEEDEDAPRAPSPGLDRLADLLAMTRAAGIRVTSESAGTPRPLPGAVDLAAYRIIQESLTNVARHAGSAAATVRLDYAPECLTVSVVNDRSAAGNRRGPVSDADRVSDPGAVNGTGSGIIGMRERAAALGGRLEAGPTPNGGFGVSAWLPLPLLPQPSLLQDAPPNDAAPEVTP